MEQKDRQKIFFVSDFHYSHLGAIYFHPERLDKAGMTMDEFKEDKKVAMAKYDEWLIEQWNSRIRKQDTVYFLGDFCLGNKERTQYILSRLKGKKFLIFGNHDKSCKGLENYFEWVGDIKEAKFTNNQFKFIDPEETFCVEMCHYPLLTWNRRTHGTVMVHGHTHGTLQSFNTSSKELRVDIGYDSEFAQRYSGFVELEDLYKYFCGIRDAAGCKTFKEYAEWKMESQLPIG